MDAPVNMPDDASPVRSGNILNSLHTLCERCRLYISGEVGWRLFCGVIYIGLSLFMMSRLGSHWSSHVIGEFGRMEDLEGLLWVQWYFKKALLEGKDFFFSNIIYYPVGYHLGAIIGRFLDAFLSLPLQLIFPGFAYYNVMCVLIFVCNAFSGYWLARTLSLRRSVAFLCGVIYAFNPFVLFEIWHGRLGLAMIFFYPLTVIAIMNVFRRGVARDYLFTVLIITAGVFNYWFNAFICAVFGLFFILWKGFRKEMPLQILLGRALLLFICCAAVLLPIVLLLSPSYSSQGQLLHEPFPSFSSVNSSSWDIKFILRASASLVNPFLFSRPAFFPTLILISFLLPLLILFTRKSIPWFWVFCASFFFIFSLGPFLKLGETYLMISEGVPVSLPYIEAYNRIPLFNMFYYPYRLEGIILCTLIPLIGISFDRIFDSRFQSQLSRLMVVGAYVAFFLFEVCIKGYGPLMASEVTIPHFYRTIAGEKGGALINIPISCCHEAILYQIFHQKPILGGPGEFEIRRYPHAYSRFLESNSFLKLFFSMEKKQYLDIEMLKKDVDRLVSLGFTHVVVHQKLFDKMVSKDGKMSYDEVVLLLESLCGSPVSVSDGQALFVLSGGPSE